MVSTIEEPVPQTNKCLNPYSRPLVVFQDVSTRHDWLVR